MRSALIFSLALGLFSCGLAQAGSVTSAVNGVWSDTNTWVGKIVPTTGDDAVVSNSVASPADVTNYRGFLYQ
jgi:hypothetical protein